jgi:spore maturation protein CgeB
VRILFANTAPIVKYGIGPALAELGHEVRYVFLDQEPSLEPYIDEFKPDIVFNDGGTGRMPKLFPLLEQRGIPHVYWAIEDPASFEDLSLPYAKKSDVVFTPCVESLADYRQHGITAHLLMFACNPNYHRDGAPDPRFNHDIIFAGNNYSYHPARQRGVATVLQPLIEQGYDVRVFGNEWWLDPNQAYTIPVQNYGGYMANEDLPAACATARIILGMHSIDTSRTMMSMRTFEVLGCGGFYLTQWTPAIEELFINHYHLVWSKSPEETLDLVKFYLQHPELRQKIARQGQAEVYRKHTYQQRVREILPYLQKLTPRAFYQPQVQVAFPTPAVAAAPPPVVVVQQEALPVSASMDKTSPVPVVVVQPPPVKPGLPSVRIAAAHGKTTSLAQVYSSLFSPLPSRGTIRFSRKPVRIKLY